MYGQLLPLGGGDPIPLLKTELLVGRRESCDIVLRFANVSAHHCQLDCEGGYWYITDLNSRNGVKVNGKRVQQRRRLDSGDLVAVAKHQYRVDYSPTDNGAVGPPPPENDAEDIMSQTLLERAGLERAPGRDRPERYDAMKDKGGRFRDPNEPM